MKLQIVVGSQSATGLHLLVSKFVVSMTFGGHADTNKMSLSSLQMAVDRRTAVIAGLQAAG